MVRRERKLHAMGGLTSLDYSSYLGLQIPVDDAAAMNVLDCRQDLTNLNGMGLEWIGRGGGGGGGRGWGEGGSLSER